MRRHGIATLVACLAVTVAACAPARADTPAPLGVASIATLTDRTITGYDREAAAIVSVGASWIRIVVNWNEIETAPGVFDWGRIDGAVTSARAHGLHVLALLTGPAPGWEHPFVEARSATPAEPADFGTFAGQAARRFATSVSHWEIWNEPNLPEFWARPDPAGYVATLRAAHRAITAVQRDATVVLGGLSTGPSGFSATDFLEGVYRAGGRGFFDAIGLHPYSYPYPLTADPLDRVASIAALRSTAQRHRQGAMRIWVTEWGQSTGTGPTSVTPAKQAEILVDGLRYLRAQVGMGPVFLFTSKDWSPDSRDAERNFGLFDHDWTPKPVVARLRSGS
ncbi:beta-1,4-xylanase [Williamsia sp. MIQD14]|uniref:beta-1,4-xylanase n=1 Tax=Williamsia sp. MIQD14 TaxID=3425703 RepID=UPI003DA08A01